MTNIYELKEGVGFVRLVAVYSLDPKAALVAYIRQSIYKDFETWTYPEEIPGMRESDTVKDHWYYDDHAGRRVISAYPEKTCLFSTPRRMCLFTNTGEVKYKREK